MEYLGVQQHLSPASLNFTFEMISKMQVTRVLERSRPSDELDSHSKSSGSSLVGTYYLSASWL